MQAYKDALVNEEGSATEGVTPRMLKHFTAAD